MHSLHVLIPLASLTLLAACQTTDTQEWRPTIGLSTTIVDSYEAEISALGYSDSEDVDYSMMEVELGATLVELGGERPIKEQFVGITFGTGDIGVDGSEGDLTEFSGGGMLYFDEGKDFIPYLSIWSASTEFDDGDLDSQLALRFGGGVEYLLSENASAFVGGDYTLPLIDAESETFGSALEGNISGLAIRLGVRFML